MSAADVRDVWDVTVGDDSHSYLAQGLFHHNSSNRPNLQNQTDEARIAYISRFDDGLIVSVDQSQIELRVAACLFGDTQMQDIYQRGADLHLATTLEMFNLTEAKYYGLPDSEQKYKRRVAKTINFGVIYGLTPMGLQANLRKEGLFLELEECENYIEVFKQKRPMLFAGMKRYENFLMKYGYVEVFTGRRRRIPEITSSDKAVVSRALRQAVNAVVQSGASEITLMSACLINRAMRAENMESKMILTVHDSLVFDCVRNEAADVAVLAKSVMENIPDLSDEVWPNLNWKWLKVPLIAEVDAGRNWKQSVKFDPETVLAGTPSGKPLYTVGKDNAKQYRAPTTMSELLLLADIKAGKNT